MLRCFWFRALGFQGLGSKDLGFRVSGFGCMVHGQGTREFQVGWTWVLISKPSLPSKEGKNPKTLNPKPINLEGYSRHMN